MLNRLPKNLYPNFNTTSRIPLKVREIIENVLENPVKIPNYLGRNSDNNKINYNFLSAEFYQTNKLQVSSFENKKHIAEYNNISKLLLDNSLNNYRDNKLIWENTPFNEKKDVFLNAANLLETKYYNQMLAYTIVAYTKLNSWECVNSNILIIMMIVPIPEICQEKCLSGACSRV